MMWVVPIWPYDTTARQLATTFVLVDRKERRALCLVLLRSGGAAEIVRNAESAHFAGLVQRRQDAVTRLDHDIALQQSGT